MKRTHSTLQSTNRETQERETRLPPMAPITFQAVFHLTETRDSEKQPCVTVPNDQFPPQLKTPMSPSSNEVDGKCHVSSTWMDHETVGLILDDPTSPGTSDLGNSPVPCIVFQLENAPTNRVPYDSLGEFSGDSGTRANTTAPKTLRESQETQKAT